MIKIWCEECFGHGWIRLSNGGLKKCDMCSGDGYTESPETQRLIELGKAVDKAMQTKNVDFDLSDDDGNYLVSFDSELLLQWYREQEGK